ncbi:iron-uptake system-binding protein [Paenibacillus cisolokensis]|uniref:Iron-uptake system-binding protein n=1 Tax=Paenibacillus cisolokensis TaxID=1658519 RepID=A0ABQ4NG07_9BACL|nr:ABC transporter substrate-binding protein [Paenibacillus cisolokensis]GIQ66796.1 iron-uptake system-binding protein [Paenibacillus cisolokensis]
MRKRRLGAAIVLALFLILLAACGGGNSSDTKGAAGETPAAANESNETAASSNGNGTNSGGEEASASTGGETGERTIEYLGQSYTVPARVVRIVITGSMEAHEDALVLDVHPVGAVTYAGKFPERFAPITDQAESIGEKAEPNFETILKLQPDVILGTTKFPEEVKEQLSKIATLIPVSHIATDWEANLMLLGELTGKQDLAKQVIDKYKAEVEAAKPALVEKLKGKKVVAIRIRSGQLFIYPQTVFVNPILYGDLGLDVPEAVAAAKAQEAISVEQLAAMNPDYLFLQFSEDENKDTQNALQDVLDNPIVQAVTAVKEGNVFVNLIDPLSEGGPAWSRTEFLKAMLEQLAK